MAKQTKREPGKRAAKKSPRTRSTARKGTAAKPASAFHMPEWVSNAWDAPLVREAVAAALVAGAGAAAAVFAHRQGLSGRKVKSAVSDAFDATRDVANATVDAFADTASDTMRGLFPGDSKARPAASASRREKGRDPTGTKSAGNVPPHVRDESS